MRFCSRCHIHKPLTAFYPRKDTASGFVSQCRSCQQKSYLKRRERILAQKRKYYEQNRSKLIVEHRQWYSRNQKANSARMLIWQRNNRALCTSYAIKRRAVKKNATPQWANHFFIHQIYDLARRRTQVTGIIWNVDHIVPLTSPLVCGLHVEHNLRVIPASKNKSKGNYHWPDMPEMERTA